MDLGGSISHHHGIGKLRRDFMPTALGETGKLAIEQRQYGRKMRLQQSLATCQRSAKDV